MGGDSRDLQEKIDRYADMLYKVAFVRLQNPQDAEDVVQETFYQYYKRTLGFDSEEHEKAWLLKVTLNGCRKLWRSAWHRHRACGEEDGCSATEESTPGAEEVLLMSEEHRQLWEAVGELPPRYRDVVHLFYYEELSVREICAVTGRRESTVTAQLTRGRELLRKKLKEGYDFA